MQLAAAILCGVFGLAGFFVARAVQNYFLSPLTCRRILSGGRSLGTPAKTRD
jgi:hypothetical protein